MMKTCKPLLDIFKNGIWPFLEIAVKLHHDVLLGKVSDSANSGFTTFKSCSMCNKRNLKPRHSENVCPSRKSCFCKGKQREKRPCPKGICDFIYEGIVEGHYDFSPNMKTTNISQWTKNYWEIAVCYMKSHSVSASDSDVIDLLHLMANNRFVLQTLLPKAKLETGIEGPEGIQDELENVRKVVYKIIKACSNIKKYRGLCNFDYIALMKEILIKIDDEPSTCAIKRLGEIERSIRSAPNQSDELGGRLGKESIVSDVKSLDKESVPLTIERYNEVIAEYIKAYEALKLKGVGDDHLSLTFRAVQKVDIRYESGDNVKNQSIFKTVFGRNLPQKAIVTTTETPDREKRKEEKHQLDEYEWFMYSILNFFRRKSDKKNGNKKSQSFHDQKMFSNIFVVSNAILDRLNLPLQTIGDFVKENTRMTNQHNLFIFDFRDPEIQQELKSTYEILHKHTVIALVNPAKDIKGRMAPLILTLCPLSELIISDMTGKIHPNSFSKTIEKSIYKFMKKMGKNNLSKLTFEHICLNDTTKKVKLSLIPNLEMLVLKSCRFKPGLSSSILSIKIEEDRALASYLKQLNLIFPLAVKLSPRLKYIKTSEIKIGANTFSIKIDKKILETEMKKCCGETLSECNREIALTVLEHSISKTLDNAKCNFSDYENANEVEKKAILKGVCYGLRKSDPNLHVYPAVYHGKNKKTVLVCYMKENFDVDKECVWGEVNGGFKTFTKSYQYVTELSDKDDHQSNEDELKRNIESHSKNIEETIRAHSTELMNKHSNLEMIGMCFRNNKKDGIDTPDKPCIALYVRLKSFVPYGESLFPKELPHPSNKEIVFKTDVHEDYFELLADSAAQYSNPLEKAQHLAMGCSIGPKGKEIFASLGPFAEFTINAEMKIGFLTVCHLFNLPLNYRKDVVGKEVVQPSEYDQFGHVSQQIPRQETNASTVCGKVIACSYNEEVDASLVVITDRAPFKGLFCYRKGDLRHAGFSNVDNMPEYTEGSVITDIDECQGKPLVKFGKQTFLTSGKCMIQNSAVRISVAVDVTCPTSGALHTHHMVNQFLIKEKSGKTFADYGDSGAGVFLVNDDKSLSCVGMVIGKTHQCGYCVATPITAILDNLSREYGHDVTLKSFARNANT